MAAISGLERGGGIEVGSTTPVAVSSRGQHVDTDIVVEWDFNNDGQFTGPHDDITRYVMSVETLTGRDYPSDVTGNASPGRLRITALNDDDRFSYFNTDSPLNQNGNSLRTGRKIRVRTAESTPADPVLLARDRFTRRDGALGSTETGQPWTHQYGEFVVRSRVARAQAEDQAALSLVDVGAVDHYAQVSIRHVYPSGRSIGLVVRWDDADNHTSVTVSTNPAFGVQIVDVDDGAGTLLANYPITAWEGMTFGAGIAGQTVTAYVAGVPVCSAELTRPVAGTQVGLDAAWSSNTGRAPELDDFHVWSHVAGPIEGVLWTGDIVDVDTAVTPGPLKRATITAEGVLARAARTEIGSPRLPTAGVRTGLLIGDIAARANLLHPPAPLDEGTVTTGPIGIPDGRALELARQVEATERGLLHETNEGQAAFADVAARAAATSAAWFSDDPGSGQYRYRRIEPLNHKTRVINQVTAGVAADAPAGITRFNRVGTSHVDITMPTVNAGDFLVIFIASTVDDGRDWRVPLWWVQHREAKAALGMRVYSHWSNGTEGGTTVRFYHNAGGAPGLWAANVVRVQQWHLSYNQGVTMGEPQPGGVAGPLVHGWGRDPTLFVIGQAGIGSATGGRWDPDFNPPDGYNSGGIITSSGVNQFDAGIAAGWKVDCTDSEEPTEFFGLSAFSLRETVVFAIRGYNGPHTKATLDDPRTTGGDGRFVTVEDLESQDEHNLIRSHPSPPGLFATETDAQVYGEAVMATHADDRPVIALTFSACRSASYRRQATRRRVGDRVTVTASTVAGLGINGDFYIESIAHQWPRGNRQWDVTWELSPA